MNERLKKIAMLRERVEEKATREKFLMLCPSIKERELTSLLSKKIIVWYAHENWDFGVQLELEDFMLYTKEVLHFIGYDDAQRGLIYSSLIVVDEAMRSAFSFLKNEYNVEIVLWKES
ncbi:hypothetical protein [Bacillus cereus]|uniref:hypothetical protein n=1 Tax=Bacillus cereus TaxID=1396 RepID=UPI000C2928AD|nr:hypothetical protein [Bacillus cereus]HDR8148136.1 hypothetical protein [Bacillus cereus]